MEELTRIITKATKKSASDVHLVTGSAPVVRVHRKLEVLEKETLSSTSVSQMVQGLLNQSQLKTLDQTGDVDVGVVVAGIGLRVNVHRQSTGLALAIRLIAAKVPSPEDLGFHEIIGNVPKLEDGLVVVSGPTGSGKSTTLASLVQEMNKQEARHIITLEDPIEYRFAPGTCLIEQRQLGVDFPSFEKGLRHVLRQDPDVIVVGEMRDPETIALALTAAETGHLVLSTLHAPNASEVIERIVNVFQGAKQSQILIQLAATLKMVVAQKLLPAKAGGLVAVQEVLVSSLAVQNAIRQNNLSVIRSAIQTGKKEGMISMDRALKDLEKAGKI
ncbi:MAG: PilT/PilU family type 4a pilus ATPase [Candidatus Uhrbacteria bacterium]|nr:PilT/PilU family type 4a pilus ATPase [Candidatus Uhrbacteria bacterium]